MGLPGRLAWLRHPGAVVPPPLRIGGGLFRNPTFLEKGIATGKPQPGVIVPLLLHIFGRAFSPAHFLSKMGRMEKSSMPPATPHLPVTTPTRGRSPSPRGTPAPSAAPPGGTA